MIWRKRTLSKSWRTGVLKAGYWERAGRESRLEAEQILAKAADEARREKAKQRLVKAVTWLKTAMIYDEIFRRQFD